MARWDPNCHALVSPPYYNKREERRKKKTHAQHQRFYLAGSRRRRKQQPPVLGLVTRRIANLQLRGNSRIEQQPMSAVCAEDKSSFLRSLSRDVQLQRTLAAFRPGFLPIVVHESVKFGATRPLRDFILFSRLGGSRCRKQRLATTSVVLLIAVVVIVVIAVFIRVVVGGYFRL